MANPQDPGTFEYWITNRITFQAVPPKTGNTGDFERWLTVRMFWRSYVEADVNRIPVFMRYYRQRRV